jgi:hypothetical protein
VGGGVVGGVGGGGAGGGGDGGIIMRFKFYLKIMKKSLLIVSCCIHLFLHFAVTLN